MGRGLLTLLCCLSCRPHGQPAAPDASEVTIPAAEADSREALPLAVHSARAQEGERLYLQAGGGTAILELGPARAPAGEATFGGFGDCTLTAAGADAGAPLVARVATWLEVPDTPASERRPLQPARCSFVLLGNGRDPSGKTWTVYKLFLGDDNEIYLRLAPDRSRAELLEKDPDYRRGLVAFLARALRDGPPAARTADSRPFLAETRPVEGVGAYAGWGAYAGAIAWIGEELISTHEGDRATKILRWPRLDGRPRELATIDGVVYTIRPDPAAKRVAVEAVFPQRPGVISGGDPMGLLLVDLGSGKVTMLRKIEERPVPLDSRWSPDGKSLAFAVPWPEPGQPESELTVVYDAATGKEAARAKLSVHPIRWDGDGLLLGDGLEPGEGKRRFLWTPGRGEPKPVKLPPPAWEHGGHRVRVVESGLAVEDAQGTRQLEPAEGIEPRAIAALRDAAPRWLGEHFLMLDEWVVDLRSLRMRRLSGDENQRLVGSSPSGHIALVHDREHPLRWARVR